MNISPSALGRFAQEAASHLYGLAIPPDDWINQLKTYQNIILEDDSNWYLNIMTIAMYLDLLVERVDDLLTGHELENLKEKYLETIENLVSVMVFGRIEQPEKARAGAMDFVRLITDTLDKTEKERQKGLTTPEIYLALLSNGTKLGQTLPDEILSSYIQTRIELFEEENFRHKLKRLLH